MLIDPPEGWKYGFPRPLPADVKDVDKWVVEQGYPQELVHKGYMKYCRYIGSHKELSERVKDAN